MFAHQTIFVKQDIGAKKVLTSQVTLVRYIEYVVAV